MEASFLIKCNSIIHVHAMFLFFSRLPFRWLDSSYAFDTGQHARILVFFSPFLTDSARAEMQ